MLSVPSVFTGMLRSTSPKDAVECWGAIEIRQNVLIVTLILE